MNRGGRRHLHRALDLLRTRAVASGTAVIDAARSGDAPSALAALSEVRVRCAHRRGPYGVATWATRIEDWLVAARPGLRPTAQPAPSPAKPSS